MLATSTPNYGARQTAYDLKKLRGKNLLTRVAKSQRYRIPAEAIRTIAAIVILREKLLTSHSRWSRENRGAETQQSDPDR